MPEVGTHTSRRVNDLARCTGASSYLEIGVHKGDTFQAVNIPHKVAVDPKFMFDFESCATQATIFHQTTSDQFFSRQRNGESFDIVFLDGLHTFEQTFRDFCNTISVTHDRSLIIIDDTIPVDIYSSHPDQRLAIEMRRQTGGSGQAWHGDVYKIIFAIHDFFPSHSYVTIATMGNPQTIVWRKSRQDFKPRFNSLERISRLDWFDLKSNIDLAHLVSEPEGLPLVVKELGV